MPDRLGQHELDRFAQQFDGPGVRALVLQGSHARGDANPYSDVDILRLTDAAPPPVSGGGSHLVEGRLVVVTDAAPADVEAWFERPELAVGRIPGLRGGRALLDRDGTFAAVQARAQRFAWGGEMQRRANAFAASQMVGWVEHVHKGLAGLRTGDLSRLLDAEFGLSWGLNRLVGVQRGVPLADMHSAPPQGWFAEVERAVGEDTEWARLRRRAFGVPPHADDPTPSLRDRVVAGLWLYAATADLLGDAIDADAAILVRDAVRLIRAALAPQH